MIKTQGDNSMEDQKKQYATPSLTIHGNVEEITTEASEENSDLPGGNDGTAYPVS